MPCSPEQLAANRKNALRSSGPKTEGGKARSRANGLKHGLTGQGIVIPPVDAAEVDRRTAALEAEMKPSGELSRILVGRLAGLSVRLDRSVRNELAAVAERVRNADADLVESRLAEVKRRLDSIADDPAASTRWLRRSPEGIDALIGSILDRKANLDHRDWSRWSRDESDRLEHLMGREAAGVTDSRVRALSRAIWGNFCELQPEDGAGLADPDRKAWARERVAEIIDEEVAQLRELRESLDFEAIERDRAEAPERALFDSSKEATLARKYEAATERGFFRTLREFRETEARSTEIAVTPSPEAAPEGLGSSLPARPTPATVIPSPPPRPAPGPHPMVIGGSEDGPRSIENGILMRSNR
jgi:hypothetical protein